MEDIFETLESLKTKYPDKILLINQCLRATSLWVHIRSTDIPRQNYVQDCYGFVIAELDDLIPKGWFNIVKAWMFKTMIKYIVKKLLESLV